MTESCGAQERLIASRPETFRSSCSSARFHRSRQPGGRDRRSRERCSRKVRALLGALPGNAWALPTSVGATDSATEKTPPTIFGSGKGEMVR